MNEARRKLAEPKPKNWAVEEALGIPIEKVSDPYPLQKRVSLAQAEPQVAAQWYYQKNCGWGPEDFSRGSGINVWWICDQGPDHVWRQRICIRVTNARGCPYCASQRVSVTNSLAKLNPKLARQWHPTKNNCKPSEVTASANYQAWWICKKGHEWKAVINNRNSSQAGCPICFETKRCTGLSNYPEFLKYFDYKKNKGIDPMKLHVTTKVWWRCDVARDHRWYSGFWTDHVKEACPFCRGTKASSTNNLALMPELKKDFKQELNPGIELKQVPLGSTTKITWKCHRCSNQWTTAALARGRDGHGCRKCSTAKRWKEYYQEKEAREKSKRAT